MAIEGDVLDTEVDEDLEIPAVEDEVETPEAGDEDGDEIAFTFDGEPDETQTPDWVKATRKRNRELEEEVAKLKARAPDPVAEIGPKPTFESSGYDEEQFEQAMDAWKEKERVAKATKTQAQQDQDAWKAEFQDDLRTAEQQEKALKAPDFKAAVAEVAALFSEPQQAVLIQASKDKAKVMYALGKHPARAAQLAAIKNPIKLAVAISDLERGLIMTNRRRSPEPEGLVRGSAQLSPKGADKELARLEAAADKTGDRTAVVRYKRAQKEKADARGK